MNDTRDKIVSEFCTKLESCLDDSPFTELGRDMKENIRAVAEVLLARMDIVSRAEFEAQNAILAEAVAKLEKIEQTLLATQQQRQQNDTPS